MNKRFWLTNVLLETGFSYNDNGINGTNTDIYNLLIEGGKIIDIQKGKLEKIDTEAIDAKGLLALPSFVDKHIHLDKGFYGGPWTASTPFISVFERIKEEEEFLPKFLDFTTERAESLLELITMSGVTHARVQCNVDPIIGLKNVERVRAALESYKDKLTYELVAFPQHGLLRSNSVPLMKEAMKNGVNLVGGLDPATIDNDIEASLNAMMDIAIEYNSDVDIHLHDGGKLGMYTIKRLTELVEEAKWQGRVTISHAYCMGDSTLKEVEDIAERLSELNISIATTVPINIQAPPIPLLYKKGVKVHVINDNINDHWSPFGTGDLLQRASRMAERFDWIDEYSLTRALGFITDGKVPLDSQGKQAWPKVGDEANIVLLEASCSAEAIARRSKRNAVMFKGKILLGNF
ncbi:amidohydrolase family protein [Desnuesiella massiliensis]|uniref:amidohydrolase family protein n=1 Tax=Desnuesiella massiliensis TaxID=1650662 RepID=UPI0006E3204B|nr:amidohydrolase family protein [Desnuesiella massiliensis]